MRKIKFSTAIPGGDRRHYLTEEDVMVVLSRLPEETWQRLRARSHQRPRKRQSTSRLRNPRAPRNRHLRASAAHKPFSHFDAKTVVRTVRRKARRGMADAGDPQISFVRRFFA